MATCLVYDERLWGSPPWQQVNATCLVNATHPATSIVNWLKVKMRLVQRQDTVYVMAHGDDGWIQLGKHALHKDNAEKWAPLSCKVNQISRKDPMVLRLMEPR